MLEMPILMSVSKSMQVLSQFYFRDTPEQDLETDIRIGISSTLHIELKVEWNF